MSDKVDKIDLSTGFADKIEINFGQYEVKTQDDGKTYLVKKFDFPKTIEDCCKVLNISPLLVIRNQKYINENSIMLFPELDRLAEIDSTLESLRTLLVCRAAYWKILDYEPDWDDTTKVRHVAYFYEGKLIKDVSYTLHHLLAFPNVEVLETFIKNFKDTITICKEFL